MSFFPQLETVYSLATFINYFDSPPSCVEGITEEDSALWYEEVATEIVNRFGRDGVDLLLKRINSADDVRLQAILASLPRASEETWQAMGNAIVKVLCNYFHDKRPSILSEVILGFSRIGYVKAKNDIVLLLKHPSGHVVNSALHFLSKHFPDIARPAILEALGSSDPIVKQAAIDEADDLNYEDALPFILLLLTDEDKYVRQAAETAVDNISRRRKMDRDGKGTAQGLRT